MRWIQVQSNRTGSVRVPPARGQPEEVERFPPERQRVLNPGIHQGGGDPTQQRVPPARSQCTEGDTPIRRRAPPATHPWE